MRADFDLEIGPILLTVLVLGEGGASIDNAQVFLFTGTVEARTGAEAQQQYLSRAAGGKMGYVQGGVPAAFSGVHVGEGTACVLPLAGDLADPDWFLAHVGELDVHCRPFTVAEAPRAQELTVVVPPMAHPAGSR